MTKEEKHDAADLDSIWSEATSAKDAAAKARAKANHATAVVVVAHETLATAQKHAAEAHLAAVELEQAAIAAASKSRQALEKRLGIPTQETKPITPPDALPKKD